MAFIPLTEDQYNSAKKAGFSHDQIVQNEQRRKTEEGSAPTDGTKVEKPGTSSEIAKGFGKGILGTIRNVSGVDSSPVVKDMVSHAPAMQQALDAQKQGIEASSPLQQVGKTAEGVAEMALPIFAGAKTIGLAKDLITGGLSKTLGKNILTNTIDAVSPKLTSTTGGNTASKLGLIKNKFTGAISNTPDPHYTKVAQTIHSHIPEFDKLPTYTDKLNAVRDTVYKLADNLKQEVVASGKDRIFPLKEFGSRLNSIELPIKIKADATLEKEFNLARQAAMKIAHENGGTVSSLFDTRKQFDQLVTKQFPNLYEKENAPMRDAITAIRSEMNKFIAENLPDVKYTDSLKQQSHLFDAIDNLGEKAFKEVGTNYISRFAESHPVWTGAAKNVGKAAVFGAGVGEAYHLFGH